MARRYNLNDYDDDEPPFWAKALLVGVLCGAVWLLVWAVK